MTVIPWVARRDLASHALASRLLDGTTNTAGYARMIVDRGNGNTFLKPPRAIASGEHMATYLLCERGFVPTITLVVARETARRVRLLWLPRLGHRQIRRHD